MTLLECLEDDCPSGFENLEVVYENSWSDYEEYGAIVVFDFFGELFSLEHGYSVMDQKHNDFRFDPESITLEELETIKKEWDEICGQEGTL